jgi:peptidyl-tRNA hydrolase
MRADLLAPVGKLMVQAGHAFVSVLEQASREQVDHYMRHQQPKIVLKAKNEAVLRRAAHDCQQLGIPHYLVTDAGRTVFNEPTITCLGIGPVARKALPQYIKKLQLLVNLQEGKMRYVIEDTLTEIEEEDSGYALVGYLDNTGTLGENDGRFFVRLHSTQDDYDTEPTHPLMDSIRGKRIRVTVEIIDEITEAGDTS